MRLSDNFRKNRALFFILLFGLGFFGFLCILLLRNAFMADYVQIVGLILGGFFGFFAIFNLIGLFYFFTTNDIWEVSWSVEKDKWKLFRKFSRYIPFLVAIVFFVIAGRLYHGNETPSNAEYVEIYLTQTNPSKVERVKSSKYISIAAQEFPKYKFQVQGVAFENMYSDYYVRNVKPGDTLVAMISQDSYNKKIAQTEPLTFIDKTVNYHFISVYGLKHGNIDLLSTSDYEFAKESDSKLGVIIFIGVGLFLLYTQYRLLKEKNKIIETVIINSKSNKVKRSKRIKNR